MSGPQQAAQHLKSATRKHAQASADFAAFAHEWNSRRAAGAGMRSGLVDGVNRESAAHEPRHSALRCRPQASRDLFVLMSTPA
jgi:hypothetical protein